MNKMIVVYLRNRDSLARNGAELSLVLELLIVTDNSSIVGILLTCDTIFIWIKNATIPYTLLLSSRKINIWDSSLIWCVLKIVTAICS